MRAHNSFRFSSRSGFTLVELGLAILIAVFVLGALYQRYIDESERARITTDFVSLRALDQAGQVYLTDRAASIPVPGMSGSWQTTSGPYYSGMMSYEERVGFLSSLMDAGMLTPQSSSSTSIDLRNFAESNAGLGLVFLVNEGPATLAPDGYTLLPSGAGNVKITASQPGSVGYGSADPVVFILTIVSQNGQYVVSTMTTG
jgi:type II secretory pathway pseudopilin PulG